MKVAVIGGGIAGVSAACELINHPSQPEVMLLEAEGQLAHHTTGRSAAQLIENYGAHPIRSLTKASLRFFHQPPYSDDSQRLLEPMAIMTVGRSDQEPVIERLLRDGQAINPDICELSLDDAQRLFPPLRIDRLSRAIMEPGSFDIDVAGLHQCFLRGFRQAGGEVEVLARVDAAKKNESGSSRWALDTTAGRREADIVVNAAGAWGDVVAERAGVEPIGLEPRRRTAFMVASRFEGSSEWPMVTDAELGFYIKPDGSQFLCSPADETPSEPLDARAEEVDVALGIDRINEATTLDIRSVRSSWAGLRTFVPDRAMVLGPDPNEPTFIWAVGQGGNGIQTAPAAGRLIADLTLNGEPSEYFDGYSLDLAGLSPDRLR